MENLTNKTITKIKRFFAKLILTFFSLFLFASCVTAKKKEKIFYNYAYDVNNKFKVAEVCNSLLPCIETEKEVVKEIKVEKETIKGQELECPQPPKDNSNTNTSQQPKQVVKCPDIEVNHTIETVYEKVKVEDTRKIEIINKEKEVLKKELEKYKSENSKITEQVNQLKKTIKKKNNYLFLFYSIIIVFIGYKAFRIYLSIKK